MDVAGMYGEIHGRIVDLVAGLEPQALGRTVPATPGWTVRDLVAHLSGNVANILSGKLDGIATDPWTAEQVDARREMSLDDVLEEWSSNLPELGKLMDAAPDRFTILVFDLFTHEQDIRGALGEPGGRDAALIELGIERLSAGLGERIDAAGLAALRLRAGGSEWIAGTGEVSASVEAEPFELMRALSGRRSAAQIEAFDWQGDAGSYVAIFNIFAKPRADLLDRSADVPAPRAQ